MLGKRVKFVLIPVLAGTLVLSACGSKEKLYVLNWGEYMDPEIIEMFEDEYNVVVVYDEVGSNEEMEVKIKSFAWKNADQVIAAEIIHEIDSK